MKVLGIDLGTSSSSAAILIDGEVKVIPSSEKKTSTIKPFPSVVTFFEDGSCLIGEPALEQSFYNPKGAVFNAKRLIGSYQRVEVYGKQHLPQFISALILMKIKLSAEKLLNEKVTKAVITVPAYFNDAQRQATRDAGKIAGLDVIHILTEPVAAAIAYGAKVLKGTTKIMVFDMGAGTLDVSIIEFSDGLFEVLATTGNTALGGIDMDKEIELFLINETRKQNGEYTNLDDEIIKIQIKKLAEEIKIKLATFDFVEINETFSNAKLEYKISTKITREQFKEMIHDILEKSESCVYDALRGAKLTPEEIDKVILVGGPTKLPIIKELLTKVIKTPEEGVDPYFVVASGAAIEGAILGDERNLPVLYQGITVINVTPLDLGEGIAQNTPSYRIKLMIPKNTPYPTEHTERFYVKPSVDKCPIEVWQGDFDKNVSFHGNAKLGEFMLEGLTPMDEKYVDVTYNLDADGILRVTAKEIMSKIKKELIITRVGEQITPPPELEYYEKQIAKTETRYRRDILSPYEIPVYEQDVLSTTESSEYSWMCECLNDAKSIISTHHGFDSSEFFKRSSFILFLQLDKQYAYAYIGMSGGPVYHIGIHNALSENNQQNQRMLTVVLVHELLHAIHPDWGHDRINPEERRLANLANYYDALHEMEILFLSGKMAMCNNHYGESTKFVRIHCKEQLPT
jgi:molecular chaperone DnaK